jgi:hypothetical protein
VGPVLWVKYISTWDGKYCADLDDGIKGPEGARHTPSTRARATVWTRWLP